MSKAIAQAFEIADTPIRQNSEGLISLTDIYQVAVSTGMAEGKRNPSDWSREAGAELIEVVAETLNTRKTGIIKATRGKGGGTFAHKNIALAYAKYLSPALHMAVNDVYLRATSGDVTLAAEISDRATPEQQEWLAKRTTGKVIRNQLTASLCTHGVVGRGYADATNAIYLPLLGATKSDICERRGIPKTTNLRDNMDIEQLFRTGLAEIVAKKNIERHNAQGNNECVMECSRAARQVAAVN